ncbi:hypothetical protein C8J27_103203 [Rhodobacter aestuarii]|uniref:Uncharacterized protein n=1 Tax=Rhodobacter aestuarii TaxID=453582 RepID=A0A1N7K3L0_9RHOB|nr:hypothetical protein [Rhodobacter aestuarii]PTV95873.1 hypothetical protein C8J27_103203 [Rhodobacter aestuarii]SIS56126.1 hypothetical protein SAMN05421580_102231 [Rhodobacter aestuarii]
MMSETETNIEIEDVLASIRRLVSSDVSPSRSSAVPHRSAAVAMPLHAPDPEPVAEPEVMAEPEAAPEPEVVSEPKAVMDAVAEEPVEDVAPEPPMVLEAALELPEAPVEPLVDEFPEPEMPTFEPVVDAVADVSEAEVSEATDQADDFLVLSPALRIDETDAEELPDTGLAEPDPMADDAPVMAEAPVEVAPQPRVLTEAEALLAEAEAALEGSGALLEASAVLDGADDMDADVALPEAPAKDDLGDELARLESTIAELEAAVAESDTEFEPEEGHPFVAEGAAPLTELPEAFDEAALGTQEPAYEAELEAILEEAPSISEDEADAAFAAEQADPDLEDAAWAETETESVGMDWAEATLNLARGAAPRRLSLEDAEEVEQHVSSRRSTYDSLREELDADAAYYDADMIEDDTQFASDERLLDEAALRDMVGQMVREELRGALGERITQNVRKLVRREIQRALMGQGYE